MESASAHASALQAELKTVDRSISQFLDRVVDADSPTLIRTYETRIRTLEEEKVANCGRPLKDFDATFRTALDFLANPWQLWVSDRLEDKRAVLKLAFAERLAYVRNQGFRTAVTSSPFKLLSQIEKGEYEVVPGVGLEPTTYRLQIGCSTS